MIEGVAQVIEGMAQVIKGVAQVIEGVAGVVVVLVECGSSQHSHHTAGT